MERVMEALKSMDIRYIYGIVGIVVVLVVLFLIWVLFLRKRMGPPAEELKNAEMAMSEAKQKEADLYAHDEYQRAEDSLAKATHLIWPLRNMSCLTGVTGVRLAIMQAIRVSENSSTHKAKDNCIKESLTLYSDPVFPTRPARRLASGADNLKHKGPFPLSS